MRVLLVLRKGRFAGTKVVVKLHTKSLRERVAGLLKQGRKEEAFALVVSKAPWETYISEGIEPNVKPDLTLVEEEWV